MDFPGLRRLTGDASQARPPLLLLLLSILFLFLLLLLLSPDRSGILIHSKKSSDFLKKPIDNTSLKAYNKANETKEGNTMTEQKLINSIVEAYIKVMGQSKWDSLNDQQKHDVIMTIVKDALKA